MATKYFDKAGKEISKKDWYVLKEDESYCSVKRFDNGVVFVELRWSGIVTQAENILPDYRPLFILLVKNWHENGYLVNDPVDGNCTFPKVELGLKAFEEFLTKWSDCGINQSTGQFVEVGNRLAPVLPPDPARPEEGSGVFEIEGMTSAW